MKYVDEFRDPERVIALAAEIERMASRCYRIMEICGGQTHAIVRHGIDELLGPSVELVHGPGCPVCVTSIDTIDRALTLARKPEVILCTFGDMMRVPGTEGDLFLAKSQGADVRIVYSPLDALELARARPDRHVAFFAVGFETTAPATAMVASLARQRAVDNFSLLVAHVLVPPALEAIAADPQSRIDAFLAAGHVCTVMGVGEYTPLASRFSTPIVVTGFEPLDILQGIHRCVLQLEAGRSEVENQYARSVRLEGNRAALDRIHEVFEIAACDWRGLGELPQSGLRLRPGYARYDAERRFDLGPCAPPTKSPCQSGLVLSGRIKPTECPEFGVGCAPERPLGAPMVSSEGACAAYYRFRGRPRGAAPARRPRGEEAL